MDAVNRIQFLPHFLHTREIFRRGCASLRFLLLFFPFNEIKNLVNAQVDILVILFFQSCT